MRRPEKDLKAVFPKPAIQSGSAHSEGSCDGLLGASGCPVALQRVLESAAGHAALRGKADGVLPVVSVRAKIGSRTGDRAGAQSGISGRRAKHLARQAIRIDDSACRKVHRIFKGIR